MKTERQNKILKIISEEGVETQKDIVTALQRAGYRVTQATVSRDIKEMKLIKVQSGEGPYRYAANKKSDEKDSGVLMRIFKDTVVSVDYAQNMIVIKTLSGSANAAAEAVDSLRYEKMLGTIAGDNTIFIATASEEASAELAGKFLGILSS